jgi:hypothetical protein
MYPKKKKKKKKKKREKGLSEWIEKCTKKVSVASQD